MPQVINDVINAKERSRTGKGGARKVRKGGAAPATIYGPKTEQRYLELEPRSFSLLRQKFGPSHIYTCAVEGGQSLKVLVREVQRNPVTDELLHVDLYALDMDKRLRLEVPLELVGKHAGAVDGGILAQVMRKVMVECLPSQIPEKLTADVTALKIGDSLHLSAIKAPEGVKVYFLTDEAIATVVPPAEEEVAATPATAEGAVAGAPGAEGAAAAPGAEGAAPAAAGAKGAAPAAAAGKDAKAAPGAKAPAGGKEGKK
jgi:large subunit ribosomal protein L25